jgi:type III pantothenate kinase
MTFLADVGNTHIKWAHIADRGLVDIGRAAHEVVDSDDSEFLAAALQSEDRRIVIANVAGAEFAARLRASLGARGDFDLRFIEPAMQGHGVRCAYTDPSRLGADRWVGIIAAHRLHDGPACIIDAGTTVTLDAVTRDGLHLGGLIMAGPEMAAAALQRETRGIGKTNVAESLPRGIDILGRSTGTAVAHGTMIAIAAGLDRALAEVAAAVGELPAVVLTGGGGAALRPWLENAVSYRPHFILEGLALIASEP